MKEDIESRQDILSIGKGLIKQFEQVLYSYDEQCVADTDTNYEFTSIDVLVREGFEKIAFTAMILWQESFTSSGIDMNDDIVPVNYLRTAFTPEELENKFILRYFTRYAVFAQDFIFMEVFSGKKDKLFKIIPKGTLDKFNDTDIYTMNVGIDDKTTQTFSLDFIFGIFSIAIRNHILTSYKPV